MTFQSSFLIRCRLGVKPGLGGGAMTHYSIQHIQTGEEYRSGSLPEVTEWMTAQNEAYLRSMLDGAAGNKEEEPRG